MSESDEEEVFIKQPEQYIYRDTDLLKMG